MASVLILIPTAVIIISIYGGRYVSFSGVDNRLVDRSAQKETCQFTDIACRPEIDNRLVGQSFLLENCQFTEHL